MNSTNALYRKRLISYFLLLIGAANFVAAGEMPNGYCIADNDSISVRGGWNYQRYLEASRQFAEALIQCAPDRYGTKTTPLWLSIIDPNTGGLIKEKPPNWQTYWDNEDYVMTAQGCNLYRDMPTLAAFYELSRLTNDSAYRQFVDEYLGYYLANMPSKTTGLFPWGEHMSYNTVRDKLIATRHELEHNLPEWEILWNINPEAVKREIEAIYNINIYDKDSFLYDRHANYYTGEFDPPPVRGTYIKHSGLFAYSFMFLYDKTKDAKYLEWARKMANLYWQYRDPKTGIVPGYVSHGGGSDVSTAQLWLAYYLLRTAGLYPDPAVKEIALGMVDSFLKYGYNPATGQFASQIVPATGQATWASSAAGIGDFTQYYNLLACWEAYAVSKEERYLEVVKTALQTAARSPMSSPINPQAAGTYIDLFVNVFQATGNKEYLQYARSLANWSLEHLLRKNLILEASNGYVYNNYNRPGILMAAWLKLYEAEQVLPLHWTAADCVSPKNGKFTLAAKSTTSLGKVTVHWCFANGKNGQTAVAPEGDQYAFMISLPKKAAQGTFTFNFAVEKGKMIDSGRLLIAESAKAEIGPWSVPKWIDKNTPLTGKVMVVDPSGVVSIQCRYQVGDSISGVVKCEQNIGEKDWYGFVIPLTKAGYGKTLKLWLEVTGNPSYPITTKSSVQSVAVSEKEKIAVSCQAEKTVKQSAAIASLGIIVSGAKPIDNGSVSIERIPMNPEESELGLPENLLPGFLRIEPDDAIRSANGRMSAQWQFLAKDAEAVLASSLGVYQFADGSWRPVPDALVDQKNLTVTFPCNSGGDFVLGGKSRLWWGRTFNGALLSSPAVARIDRQGKMAIILDTRDADGVLYALDSQGRTLWTYDAGEMQPFPTVADLDGDGLDEIAVGGPSLILLNHVGVKRWQTSLTKVASPVIGDIDGDGKPEIVAATDDGIIAAFTASGQELWRANASESLEIPALGDLNGDRRLEVIAGGEKSLFAFSGKGKLLWQAPLSGKTVYGPAVGDINKDGREEVIHFCRDDNKGTMSAFDGKGKTLWSVTVSRESDWSPIIADLDGSGEPRILAQSTDPRKLEIYDAQGKLVRSIATTGRLLQTPVPLDLNADGRLDLLSDYDLSYRMWAIANNGQPLWSYTPKSYTLPGSKIKGGGSLLISDLDGDGFLDVVGGDDETWLNAVKTDTPCKPWQVISGQYHGDCRHSGNYMLRSGR